MINFTRAFDLAWERMIVILFRPFDLGKWFTIGFSAFLAGLLSGGNGFNGTSYNNNLSKGHWSASYNSNLNQLNSNVSQAVTSMETGFTLVAFIVGFVLVVALVLLIFWLGSRGQFLLLDNVVRNRGAISWPWQVYARAGNSLFGFYLLYTLVTMLVLLPITIACIFAGLPLFRQHRWPDSGEFPGFIALGLIYLIIAVAFGVMLFLFRELGVPLMFRRNLLARAAFVETWRLMQRHPGSIFVFVLLRVALFLALVVVSTIACCVTCCIGALPYLGTVVLLPAILFIKCFTLDFLSQFGPESDVWTVDVPPATGIPTA
jgi:hypothetical protein